MAIGCGSWLNPPSQAFAGVGKVTLETGNMTFDDAFCRVHPDYSPGAFVFLTVGDDGCGMDQETLDSIFEPYFTTKEMSRGVGLGLPTVYGIVSQNNGFIIVHSTAGKGTTFTVYLPRHAGAEPEMRTENASRTPLSHGETVLLVEDEPAILTMGQAMLQHLGYRVLAAGTPRQALALAAEHGGRIDILITDVVMPEMNGRDLADRLTGSYPRLKTLFMSGYTADVIAHRGVLDQGMHFIQKPFSLHTLGIKVRTVLDDPKRLNDGFSGERF